MSCSVSQIYLLCQMNNSLNRVNRNLSQEWLIYFLSLPNPFINKKNWIFCILRLVLWQPKRNSPVEKSCWLKWIWYVPVVNSSPSLRENLMMLQQFGQDELGQKRTHWSSREKKYVCKYCSKGFVLKRDCLGHINSRHLGLKPYSCEHCGRTFSHNCSLLHHKQICRS